MNVLSVILSSLGGIVALLSGLALVFRAIIRNVHATNANTAALKQNEKTLVDLKGTVDQHTITLAILQDRIRGGKGNAI